MLRPSALAVLALLAAWPGLGQIMPHQIGGCDTGESLKQGAGAVMQCTDGVFTECSRTITAGSGLSGGGSLCADRTIDLGVGDCFSLSADSVQLSSSSCSGNMTLTGAWNFGGALSNQPCPKGTALPGTCGDEHCFWKSDTDELHFCEGTNVWVHVPNVKDSPVWTGTHDYGGATGLEVPNSTSRPATCTTGQVYYDSDASTGARFCFCSTTNTWACFSEADTDTDTLVGNVFSWGSTSTSGTFAGVALSGAITDQAFLTAAFEGTAIYPGGMSDKLCVEASCDGDCGVTSTVELRDADNNQDLTSATISNTGTLALYCSSGAFSNLPSARARLVLRQTQTGASCDCTFYSAYWVRWK